MSMLKKNNCACGKPIAVEPQIVKGAALGIIGEFPGEVELLRGRPFVGPTGDILRRELTMIGIQPHKVVMTNLWLHEPDKVPEDACIQWNLKRAIQTLKACPIVLLLGSECSLIFLQQNVSEVCGLWVKSPLLPKSEILACYNPAILLHGTLGEWRLAMKRLKEKL